MPRARNIKPSFFVNDELAKISSLGRLLFIGLWTVADREGRLKDKPEKIKVQVLPYDKCNVNKLLQDLHDAGFILRYETENCPCIQILNFSKHQNPHIKEQESELPAPDLHHASTIQEPDKHGSCPADSLNLIPDTSTSSENKFSDASLEMKMTKFMIDKILESYPQAKIPQTENQLYKWALAFNRLMRIDKRTVDDIRAVMQWIYQDDFWSVNIRSPDKLREKWDTVYLQMAKKVKQKPTNKPIEQWTKAEREAAGL